MRRPRGLWEWLGLLYLVLILTSWVVFAQYAATHPRPPLRPGDYPVHCESHAEPHSWDNRPKGK